MSSCYLFLLLCLSLLSTNLHASSDHISNIISYNKDHNVQSSRTHEELVSMYESWLVKYGKTYNALGEKETRFNIFKDNLKYIDEQNGVPNRSYKLGLNRFADLTNEEYRQKFVGTSVKSDRYETVPVYDEKVLLKAAANQPISVMIEAGGRDFQLYDSGVFSGTCGTDLDHGVGAVGYGSESGEDYWLVKNSWGPNWGENGYAKMKRNVASSSGTCGIAIGPSYATKTSANLPNPCHCLLGTTCCCKEKFHGECLEWGCCPIV